jgi:transcriptional regulator with XRE-family HTH domain
MVRRGYEIIEETTRIGRQIRDQRREMDWTINRLSINSGLSNSAIANIEKGRVTPSRKSLQALSRTLGISMRKLEELI